MKERKKMCKKEEDMEKTNIKWIKYCFKVKRECNEVCKFNVIFMYNTSIILYFLNKI